MKKYISFALIFIVCALISCSTMAPIKGFKTELWYLNKNELSISRYQENGKYVEIPISELDPAEWVIIKLNDIVREWEYQSLLKKSCERWR